MPKYRLDNELRQLRDLERCRDQCIDVPSAQRECIYFGFQGVLNLVIAEDLPTNVFRYTVASSKRSAQGSREPREAGRRRVFEQQQYNLVHFLTSPFCFDADTMGFRTDTMSFRVDNVGFRHPAIDQSNVRIEYSCGLTVDYDLCLCAKNTFGFTGKCIANVHSL